VPAPCAFASSAMSNENVIVVDNGTGYVKAGYAGDNIPRKTFSSMVGRPTLRAEEDFIEGVVLKVRARAAAGAARRRGARRCIRAAPQTPACCPASALALPSPQDIMVGDEAVANRRALEISYPLENGVVRNWEDMEHVWSYLFAEKLRTPTEGKRVLLTEAPMNPKENKRKMLEVMFEKYGFGFAQLETQAILTLYGQGRMTGLVLDSGDGVTHIVSVYQGYVLPHLTRRLDVAGRHITRYMTKLLQGRGYAFNRTADEQTVAEIKEKLCYVALDPARELRLAEDTTVLMEKYTLPDGRVISVGAERFQAAEALFSPELVGVESPGMSNLVWDVIQAADLDIRAELYKGICLSGGSTMYPGLPSRLEHDIKAKYLELVKGNKSQAAKLKLEIVDPPRRKHAVFEGASVIASIYANNDQYWFSKAQYAEVRPRRRRLARARAPCAPDPLFQRSPPMLSFAPLQEGATRLAGKVRSLVGSSK
jgi:actin-related protein 2